MWTTFNKWLSNRTADLLPEVSSEFPKTEINTLFANELDSLLAQDHEPEVKQDLEEAKDLDWVGYVARSLRNAGFLDHDIDPLTHEIAVRLVVQPGTLFRGWDGQPIQARFKVAVRNAVLNLVERRRRRRRRLSSEALPDEIVAREFPWDEAGIEEFRELVRDRKGVFALAVLDLRLAGGDTKTLIGSIQFGKPTAYRIKLTVQEIKALAQEFGDESFRAMVARAMAEEDKTLAKRFAGRGTLLRQESLVGPEFDRTGMYPVASTDRQKKTARDYAASLTDRRVLRKIQRKSKEEADLIRKRLPPEKLPASERKGL